MRYRLQRRENYFIPNILGNCSQPVPTYRWKDILASNDKEALEKYVNLGFIIRENGKVRFTDKGFDVSNFILSEII